MTDPVSNPVVPSVPPSSQVNPTKQVKNTPTGAAFSAQSMTIHSVEDLRTKCPEIYEGMEQAMCTAAESFRAKCLARQKTERQKSG